MAWALKLPLADEVIESGLVQDFDASLSGIGQELGAGAYSMSDVLALPIFKQEESSLPPDNENEILPFQYVLCAATSPAVKLHDETLTYLNQGQTHSHLLVPLQVHACMSEVVSSVTHQLDPQETLHLCSRLLGLPPISSLCSSVLLGGVSCLLLDFCFIFLICKMS